MEAHRARAELDEAMLTVAGAHTDLGAGGGARSNPSWRNRTTATRASGRG